MNQEFDYFCKCGLTWRVNTIRNEEEFYHTIIKKDFNKQQIKQAKENLAKFTKERHRTPNHCHCGAMFANKVIRR